MKHYDGPERRSRALPYRLYRFFCRRGWGVSWPLLLAVSIGGIIISFSGLANLQPPIVSSSESGSTALWAIGIAISIIVGVLAVIAGVEKLAGPVARRTIHEHNHDPEAHSGLSTVAELKRQFDDSARRHAKLATAIAVVDERIRIGFENLPCKESRGDGCPPKFATRNDEDE